MIVIKSEHLLRNTGVKLIAFILAVLLLSTGIFVLEQTATTKWKASVFPKLGMNRII